MPYVHPVEHDTPADVAELVDALVSGTSGGNIVGVQVSPSALLLVVSKTTTQNDRPQNFQRFRGGCIESWTIS